jgi:membrane protein
MKIRTMWQLLAETYRHWRNDNTDMVAAALAYYTLFSLAPTLIVMTAVAGLIFGRQAVTGQLFAAMQGWVGPDVATTVQTMVASVSRPDANIVLSLLALGASLYGGSHLFFQLQQTLNLVWKVPLRASTDVIGLARDRFMAFAMVLTLGFLLFLLLLFNTLTAVMESYLGLLLPQVGTIIPIVRISELLLSLALSTLLFSIIYKTLPDSRVAWGDVWLGALLVSFIFTVTKYLFGLYVGYTSAGSPYGVAGSLLFLLLWVFYSVHAFLIGAAFTYVYAHRFGSRAYQSRRENRVLVSPVEEEPRQASPFSQVLRPYAELLPPIFRDIWLLPAAATYQVVLRGTLDEVWRRPSWLSPLFRLMQKGGGLIAPPGKEVTAVITITSGYDQDRQPFHLWQRTFAFSRPQQLNTKIVYDSVLEAVVERFGPREMLQLVWEIRFRAPSIVEMETTDCVLHFRQWRSSLPRWSWLATRFQAEVEAPHSERLHIQLLRSHSLFGKVFGYEGAFEKRLEALANSELDKVAQTR